MKKFLTVIAVLIMLCVTTAFADFAGYSTANFHREGGADWVIGGESTGYLTIGPYGAVRFLESGTDPNHYTKFTAGDQTAEANYVLPTALPTSSGYVLSCTTAGVLSWATGTFNGTYVGTTNINATGTAPTTIGNESAAMTLNGVTDINFTGGSQMKIDPCDITNSQIKAMFTTPIVLVQAPGAHKMISVLGITLIHNYAGAQFDANAAAITPAYYYATSDTNTACTSTVTITQLLQTAGADRIYTLTPVAVGGAATLFENCPVRLTLPAGTGDPTGSSATGTMRAIISYRILPTGL